MAVLRIHTALNVEKIYCEVTCPECKKTVKMKMRGPVTRKNCPKCNRLTYVFTVTPLRGYVQVTILTTGSDFHPREYAIKTTEIEIIEDEAGAEDLPTEE